MKPNISTPDFATQLVYPATWRKESIATYERLAALGKVDQAEVDRVEARLQWFRSLRAA